MQHRATLPRRESASLCKMANRRQCESLAARIFQIRLRLWRGESIGSSSTATCGWLLWAFSSISELAYSKLPREVPSSCLKQPVHRENPSAPPNSSETTWGTVRKPCIHVQPIAPVFLLAHLDSVTKDWACWKTPTDDDFVRGWQDSERVTPRFPASSRCRRREDGSASSGLELNPTGLAGTVDDLSGDPLSGGTFETCGKMLQYIETSGQSWNNTEAVEHTGLSGLSSRTSGRYPACEFCASSVCELAECCFQLATVPTFSDR